MSKYSALFEDEDDIFLGTPISKLMDIIFTANNDVVRFDLENFMRQRAVMEILLEEHLGENYFEKVKTLEALRGDDIETKTKSLAIELTGEIVSKSE